MSDSLYPRDLGIIVRNTQPQDIPKITDLQKESFPYLARYRNIWRPEEFTSMMSVLASFIEWLNPRYHQNR
jgi:hypothetical protein